MPADGDHDRDRNTRDWGRVVSSAVFVVLLTILLVAAGVAGVLVFEGPAGLEERADRITGDDRIPDPTGVGETNDTTSEPDDEIESAGAGAPWPDHPQDREFSPLLVERLVAEEINEIRAEENLSRLEPRPAVITVARDHSRDMDERGYFDHVNPDQETPQDRIDDAGVDCAVGENIAQMWYEPALPDGYAAQGLTSEAEVAEALVEGWMESPGHRENILTPGYESHGIGVYKGEDGAVYATHKFCLGSG